MDFTRPGPSRTTQSGEITAADINDFVNGIARNLAVGLYSLVPGTTDSVWTRLDLMLVLWLVAYGMLTLAVWHRFNLPASRRPPGPSWCWTYLMRGHLGELNTSKFHESLRKLANRHGSIYELQLCGTNTVVLSDQELIRKAFSLRNFCHQAPLQMINYVMGGRGLMNASIERWVDQRPIVETCLRNLAIKKDKDTLLRDGTPLDKRLRTEIESALQKIRDEGNVAFDPHSIVKTLVDNLMAFLILHKDFEMADRPFDHLMEMHECHKAFGLLWYFRFKMKSFDHAFLKEIVEARINASRPEPPQSFLDSYINEWNRCPKATHFDADQLYHVLGELMSSGKQTLLVSLMWGLYRLMLNPQVVNSARREIQKNIGSRAITPDDEDELPFVNACVYEIQRMHPAIPLGMPHGTARNCELKDYVIPEDSLVFGHIYAVQNDSMAWTKPKEFNPGRFLNKEQLITLPDEFMPFGVGHRACPAKDMAHTTMFMVLGSIMQRNQFECPGTDIFIPHVELDFSRVLSSPRFPIRFSQK